MADTLYKESVYDEDEPYTPTPSEGVANPTARGFLRAYEDRSRKAAANYDDIMRQRTEAIARVKADLDSTIAEMRDRQSGGAGAINLPLLALGAGLLSPEPGGRIGNFGSELSRGLTAMGSTIAAQRNSDADLGQRVAQLKMKSGELEDLPMRDRATMARQEQLANEAQRARIEAALIRAEATGKSAGVDPALLKEFEAENKYRKASGMEPFKTPSEWYAWKSKQGSDRNTPANLRTLQQENEVRKEQGLEPLSPSQWERIKAQEGATGREKGKATGEADVALPATIQDLDYIDQTLERIEKHPGAKNAFGMMSLVPNRPGSTTSDFDNLRKQLESQTFLTAVQKMRGLGALTEMEGKKVTDAVAALSTTQSEKQFRENLDVLKNYLAKSRSVAKQKAGKEERPVDEKPPLPDAKKAPDGKWYVVRDGKYFRVGE